MSYTAHVDTFARDNAPPPEQRPDILLERPEYRYPARLNCGVELLDRMIEQGCGPRRCLVSPHLAEGQWTYAELRQRVDRIAHVLVEDLGVVPGNRVLLRGSNSPMMVACWLAVMKAGAIAVATMPLLRAGELAAIIDKAQVTVALCDARLADELVRAAAGGPLGKIIFWNQDGPDAQDAQDVHDGLEARMAARPDRFDAVDTAADDICLIAFTSGTTGQPKGCMHAHRDMLAMCDGFSRQILQPAPDDLFVGSPPIAFTFGLGGLVIFPMRAGAAMLMLEKAGPAELLDAVERHGATVLFTSPTAYRMMIDRIAGRDISSLRKCVSAGETLPRATWEAFEAATGIGIIDGIGSTELLHIFIAAAGAAIRPGSTGKPVPGYEARVIDDAGNEVPPGTPGRLAVRGPTGCRYLADARQREYVQDGWNLTGDTYVMDADGYFWYQARSDDMIISSGYNIAGPEVEAALLQHEAVAECAVVGAPDPLRGTVVMAYVVPRAGVDRDAALIEALQGFVKATIAPYKYPRIIELVDALPRTQTGKVQRFRLRQMAEQAAEQTAKQTAEQTVGQAAADRHGATHGQDGSK